MVAAMSTQFNLLIFLVKFWSHIKYYKDILSVIHSQGFHGIYVFKKELRLNRVCKFIISHHHHIGCNI